MLDSLPSVATQTQKGDLILVYDKSLDVQKSNFVHLDFAEEPCGFEASQGLGFLQVEFGDRIGPDGRYEILRKLGWGMQSSIWLAKDTPNDRFVAIKALTGFTTSQVKKGLVRELDMLRLLSSCKNGWRDTHCLFLLDDFIQPGRYESDGEHLCFVTDPFGPSLSAFMNAGYRFTKPLIKKILLDILVGLDTLHSVGIVHTDLTSSNILVGLENDGHRFDIDSFIKAHPSERHPPELTWGGRHVRVAKSQPFLSTWSAPSSVIADFGIAQFLTSKVTDNISPPEQCAPETILGLPWDEKVDIWAFGCMAFKLINRQKLFKTSVGDLPVELAVLYQILVFTEERLPPETIRSSPTAMKYLDPETGWVTAPLIPVDIDLYRIIKEIGALKKPEDLDGATALMKKCLRINPKDRASAKDLLQDPWLNSET
ncbi:hypothetical protein ACEPAG_2973 [Sanghuangporus baumii]